MRQYIILFHDRPEELAPMVQAMLEQGGQLVGGLAFSGTGFAQAMTMPGKWKPK